MSYELRRCGLVLCAFLVLCSHFTPSRAQVAGLSTLSVLDMPTDARAAAFGMDYLALPWSSTMMQLDNPSLVLSPAHNVSLTVAPLFDRSTFGAVAYGFRSPLLGEMVVGIRFANYGTIEGYDVNDMPTGEFHAGDYMLVAGWGMAVDSNFSIGAALKTIFSQYDTYKAWAVAVDVAGSYVSDNRRFAASVMARNIGAQIITFDGTVENLPFELSATCSYKLERAPFRLFAALNELQHWDLRYEDELNPSSTTDPFTGEVSRDSDTKVFFDRLARHVVVGLELEIGRSFFVRMGYNYRQTRETQYVGNANGSAFSFGATVKARRFDISYGRNNYHLSQAVNYFTLDFKL